MEESTRYKDNELIEQLRISVDALDTLYMRHRDYALRFMSSMYHDANEILDIYQDAILVLYEKSTDPEFILTCSIQTYINSICRNQILMRLKGSAKIIFPSYDQGEEFDDMQKDWIEPIDDENNERLNAMKRALQCMKLDSSKCYEILVRFWYRKHTMDRIAREMGYANADSMKNQKARCQKEFKKEVFKLLHGKE